MDQGTYQEIINRYLDGTIELEDTKLLNEYVKTAEGRALFDATKKNWRSDPVMNEYTAQRWNQLCDKLQPQNEITLRSNHPDYSQFVKWIAVAAIFLVGLFAGFFANKYQGHTTDEKIVFETPKGEKSIITLPDGTKVWLNAKTQLTYHSNSTKSRRVELQGEAFFKVRHNDLLPFIVSTDQCDVKVLGTTFNVMSYKEFGRQEITLVEGSVTVYSGNKENKLLPGQMMVLKDGNRAIVPANNSQTVGWVENKFNFTNIPLSELMKRLENWYDVEISLNNPTGKEVNFTGSFKNEETIWQVLDAISIYTPITYDRTDTRKLTITIRK